MDSSPIGAAAVASTAAMRRQGLLAIVGEKHDGHEHRKGNQIAGEFRDGELARAGIERR